MCRQNRPPQVVDSEANCKPLCQCKALQDDAAPRAPRKPGWLYSALPQGNADCSAFPCGTGMCRRNRPPQVVDSEASCKPLCQCKALQDDAAPRAPRKPGWLCSAPPYHRGPPVRRGYPAHTATPSLPAKRVIALRIPTRTTRPAPGDRFAALAMTDGEERGLRAGQPGPPGGTVTPRGRSSRPSRRTPPPSPAGPFPGLPVRRCPGPRRSRARPG